MMVETYLEHDFTSFRTKDIDIFVKNYTENCMDQLPALRDAMDAFDKEFEKIKIPVTSITYCIKFCV